MCDDISIRILLVGSSASVDDRVVDLHVEHDGVLAKVGDLVLVLRKTSPLGPDFVITVAYQLDEHADGAVLVLSAGARLDSVADLVLDHARVVTGGGAGSARDLVLGQALCKLQSPSKLP